MLTEIVRIEATALQAQIDFEDQECLDIGSFLVLQEIKRHLAPVYIGGHMGIEVQRVIDAVGLRSALRMKPFQGVRDHSGIWPFTLRQRRPANTSTSATRQLDPQKREVVADEFVDIVNKWLELVAEQQLTLDGRRHVKNMMGEALDNAERHSQIQTNDGDWSMTGYLVKRELNGKPLYWVHIAMLSVGATIRDSIMSGPPAMLENLWQYVGCHRHHLPEEALATVFALQDGVTRDKSASGRRGGTGLQDIFSFFSDLGATDSPLHPARLVIISGNTCISLHAPYFCGERDEGGTERKLWFNPENTPEVGPDNEYVFSLPCRLNGTLISMAIPLDQVYLEATADEREDD